MLYPIPVGDGRWFPHNPFWEAKPLDPVAKFLQYHWEQPLQPQGKAPETFYGQSAHDQGYLNAAGIPAANFGSGEQDFAHTDRDMASVDKTFAAAKVYAWMIASHLGA